MLGGLERMEAGKKLFFVDSIRNPINEMLWKPHI
jgi:hypothetical protein